MTEEAITTQTISVYNSPSLLVCLPKLTQVEIFRPNLKQDLSGLSGFF